MKWLSPCLALAIALSASVGCAKKEASPLQRKEAAHLVSEAQFAATVRDFARAENLLDQATKLVPDTGPYWLSLGSMRVRLGQKDSARTAYKSALVAFEAAANKDPKDTDAAIQQVYVLALLGRVDDARKRQEKLLSRYPDNHEVRAFVEQKRLDQLLNDPVYKQSAL